MVQQPGQRIDKYELVRQLAQGGMGTVWAAKHLGLDAYRALKFPRTQGPITSGELRRFRREARLAAQLQTPHAVHIYDFGVHQGVPYLAMELLDGEDLGIRLQRVGRLSVEEAMPIMRDAARGLRAAHESGLVHRDVKPSNLFIARQGDVEVVKVLDFGIALDRQLTADTTGTPFGSPAYMSPEQARGGHVDERSDIWSLGAVAYRALTGQLPFDGASSGDIVVKLCTERVTPPTEIRPDLPRYVDELLLGALTRDPDRRFSSARELEEALESHAESWGRASPGAFVPRADPEGVRVTGRDTATEPLSPLSSEGHAPLSPLSSEGHAPLSPLSSEGHAPLSPLSSEGHAPAQLALSEEPPARARRRLLVLASGAAALALLVGTVWALSRGPGDTVEQGDGGEPVLTSSTTSTSVPVVDTAPPQSPEATEAFPPQRRRPSVPEEQKAEREQPQDNGRQGSPSPRPSPRSVPSAPAGTTRTETPAAAATVDSTKDEDGTPSAQTPEPARDPIFGLPVEEP